MNGRDMNMSLAVTWLIPYKQSNMLTRQGTARQCLANHECRMLSYLSVLARPCTVCLLSKASRSVPGGLAGPAGGPIGTPGGRKEGMPPNAPAAGPDIPICMLCWPGSMARIGPPATQQSISRHCQTCHHDMKTEGTSEPQYCSLWHALVDSI